MKIFESISFYHQESFCDAVSSLCLSQSLSLLSKDFLYAYDRVKKKTITFLIGAVIICNVNLIKLRLVNLLLYDTVDKI